MNDMEVIKQLDNTNEYSYNKDKVLHSKEREIFNNIYWKRLDNMEELPKIIVMT